MKFCSLISNNIVLLVECHDAPSVALHQSPNFSLLTRMNTTASRKVEAKE